MNTSANTQEHSTISGLFQMDADSLDVLRERVLVRISWFIIVAGLILLAVSVPDYLAAQDYGSLAVDLGGFGTLLVLTILQKRVSFRVRALALIAVTISQGMVDLGAAGVLGDSRIWFLFSCVFATILLGLTVGLIANVLTIGATLATMALVLTGNDTLAIPEYQTLSQDLALWLDVMPIFIMASLFITFTLGTIIRGMEQSRDNLEEAYTETRQLTSQLAEERGQLEIQSSALERRSRYIEAAAEVGKAATSILEIRDLLDNVVNLISEQFSLYQVGIFFIDDENEFAVLQAASSEGGQRMLARQHKLKVGAEGMVGYVTSQGQARIALDVGEDAAFFDTPELPQTRSEMTLPLFYGGRVFGALDVQSTEPNAFSEDDISALTVLADQVSMAINNARLFSDLQTSLEAERRAFGEVSRQAWQSLIRRSGTLGYKFQNNRVSQIENVWPAEMIEALQKQQKVDTFKTNGALSVPIMVSGRAVGAIRVCKPASQVSWSADEVELIETLTDRLSQALESARIYQASQRQALQEQLTGEISSQLRQTLDIDTVLKTAARELGDAFNAKEVVIRMAPNEPTN